MLLFLFSCTTVSTYPLNLSYLPKTQLGKKENKFITVALFNDKRVVMDKRFLGKRDNEINFISLPAAPAETIAVAFQKYLESRGYSANRLEEVWDGTNKSIIPGAGEMVIGGTIEDFAITVNSDLVQTEYACKVKLFVVLADPSKQAIKHQETIEVTSSLTTVPFSLDQAQQLMNNVLAEVVEKSLADINSHLSLPTEQLSR